MYETRYLSREELFALCGVGSDSNEYTPATVGKNHTLGSARMIWADCIREVNFTNLAELKAMTPETVHSEKVYYLDANQQPIVINDKQAIIGDETKGQYGVHSKCYKIVQHKEIVDVVSKMFDETNINVFGHTHTKDGKFYGFANIANPEYHIPVGQEFDSAFMLGIKFHNGHDGLLGFGGDIYAIRKVCGNYCAWGDVLGSFYAKHFSNVFEAVEGFRKVVEHSPDFVDSLGGTFHSLKDQVLTAEEQEALLLGLHFSPKTADNILFFKKGLNPEIKDENHITAYDMYNVLTAYNTYREGSGRSVQYAVGMADNIQKMLTKPISKILGKGFEVKTELMPATA